MVCALYVDMCIDALIMACTERCAVQYFVLFVDTECTDFEARVRKCGVLVNTNE